MESISGVKNANLHSQKTTSPQGFFFFFFNHIESEMYLKCIYLANAITLDCAMFSLKRSLGTSLVVQWERLHAPNAGGPVGSPVGELDPACMPQLIRVRMPQLKKDPACRN